MKSTGFNWRKARVVLTCRDPEYVQKVQAIKAILAALTSEEAFFSIDEYGPFSIKKKGGRKRVAPGESYVVPRLQSTQTPWYQEVLKMNANSAKKAAIQERIQRLRH